MDGNFLQRGASVTRVTTAKTIAQVKDSGGDLEHLPRRDALAEEDWVHLLFGGGRL